MTETPAQESKPIHPFVTVFALIVFAVVGLAIVKVLVTIGSSVVDAVSAALN